jgi:hypothetical protein
MNSNEIEKIMLIIYSYLLLIRENSLKYIIFLKKKMLPKSHKCLNLIKTA